jgi:hypothetical protein
MGERLARAFSRDYAQARERFIAAARLRGATLARYVNPQRGPGGAELSTDVARFGHPDARDRVHVLSATHGVEGFCGSAIQIDWMLGGGPTRLPDDVAVILVHAINPHGFAWERRVTEEGVDLNRNFVNFSQPLPDNPGYVALAGAFHDRFRGGEWARRAHQALADHAKQHGDRAVKIAYSAGQYVDPAGVFFGGKAPTWSRRTHEAIMTDFALARAERVAGIDLHTGLGPYGYGEPICNHAPGSKGVALCRLMWGPSVTETALGTSVSIPRTGLTLRGYERLMGDRVGFVTLEFGTHARDVVEGALAIDQAYWARPDADPHAPEAARARAAMREAYYPDRDDWREMVLFRGEQMIRQAIIALAHSAP